MGTCSMMWFLRLSFLVIGGDRYWAGFYGEELENFMMRLNGYDVVISVCRSRWDRRADQAQPVELARDRIAGLATTAYCLVRRRWR